MDYRDRTCDSYVPKGGTAGSAGKAIDLELRAGLSGARQGIDTGICLAYASAYAR